MYSTEPSALARQAIAGIESSVACSWTACSARLRSVKSRTNATPSLLPLTSTEFCPACIGFAAFAAAALLAPGVHEYSPKRTIFDQIADCFSSLRQRKDPADRRLQLTFLQEFQESCVRCSHRLLGEESEGEPADRCSLPDDVGNVDLGLTSSSVAGSDHSATKGERRERLTSQFSADAVDDDIDALAFGDPHNTLLEAFLGEVDHMIISSRASLVCLFGAAGSRDR